MRKFLVLLAIMALLSCEKKSSVHTSSDSGKTTANEFDSLNDNGEMTMISDEDIARIVEKFGNNEIRLPSKNIKKPSYKFSGLYKKEVLEFKTLKLTDVEESRIGVVGTTGVKMYASIEGKDAICEIPKGTIIALNEELGNPATKDEGGLYQFGNEYNYWYETEFQGNKGFVFGSYIAMNEETLRLASILNSQLGRPGTDTVNERLIRLSYFYNKKDKFDEFYEFNGSSSISKKIKDSLLKDRIAFEKINYSEYGSNLDIDNPDDMIVLYKTLHGDKMASTFITTDFLVHNLHLLFDRMLQDTEERIMLPILMQYTKKNYERLSELEKKLTDADKEYKQSVETLKKYFLVAGTVLKLELTDKTEYPTEVNEELELIEKAEGFVESTPVFKYREDYSQFKPRGHYTKTENLKTYFKAMMWYGRLHFYCSLDLPTPEEVENSIRLTRAALLITKIAKENKEIYGLWKALFEPITYIVGASDDYNLDQYLSISGIVDFNGFGKWISDRKNIEKFITKADKELKFPKISGNTLDQDSDGLVESITAPPGFRAFGQRFTFDSFIHNLLSSPRIDGGRFMVKGLDIMSVLGSKQADKLVTDEKKQFPGYEKNINRLRSEFDKFSDEDFRGTFYNSYLKIISEINKFDNTMPFYFTQGELWDKKSLLTSHASWAELRHDTILYVKQSYAEKAGKGPGFTWVIDEIERPIGYVEPNLGAIYWIQSVLEDSVSYLSQNGFMSGAFQEKFEAYSSIINELVKIVENEANDEPITREQNELIYTLPYRLSGIILPTASGIVETKDFQMALVADVHTDSFKGEVLEAATGIPYRLYVALNDGHGGKRLAEGYTYSYYEFKQPMSDRLNDDQWKEKVYGDDDVYMEERIPLWFKGTIIK